MLNESSCKRYLPSWKTAPWSSLKFWYTGIITPVTYCYGPVAAWALWIFRTRSGGRSPMTSYLCCETATCAGPTSRCDNGPWATAIWRSEEHTSELQSRGHLVCRLLLEKKK